jgi:hypothetical protein
MSTAQEEKPGASKGQISCFARNENKTDNN